MPKGRDYDREEIAKMRATLKALPRKQRVKTRVSTQELVKEMRAEIRGAMSRGYTLDEVITVLNSAGTFDLKAPTIKRYLTETTPRRTANAISGRLTGRKNGDATTQGAETVRKKARAVELPSADDL